ncbi:hypothetical protein MFIFM68171_10208 [Madurella fahalii]|uniref:Heterokaryon incompatibility domain-containing protein n=1 Tax=Madurella fahalii TaxID=1157608 RepID=A0ABQ0GQJ4_9PEZI
MAHSDNTSERAPLMSTQRGSSRLSYDTNSTSRQQLYSQLTIPSGSFTIRLLDLQAAPPGRDEAPLTGRLRVAHLADRPEFTSLSYVWGATPEPNTPRFWLTVVSPERVDLEVTENLHHALRRIRRHVGAVTIWVDAVCIDQDDGRDKETQIPLMEEIYSMAQVGYIWLGESSQGLDFAVKCLKSRASISRRLPLAYVAASQGNDRMREWYRLEWRKWSDIFARLCSGRILLLLDQRCPSWFIDKIEDFQNPYMSLHTEGEELVWLLQFFCSPWVFRAWTFQELVLSENPVFLCGHNLIPWEDIVSAVYQPDISTALTVVLAPWRSLVDIWLGVPRRSRRSAPDTSNVEGLQLAPSFGELVRHSIRHRNNSLFWATTYWICVAFAQLGYWALYSPIYLIVMISNRNDPDLAMAIGGLISVLFGIPAILLSFNIYFFSRTFLDFVLTGRLQTWLERSCADAAEHRREFKNIFVPAIWTALRERISSNPMDKAFALSGVLKASGASPSPPDYSQPASEVFKNMLRDLIAWEPAFVTLIMSGGSKSRECGWPSWLANWNSAESNTWLVDRYRNELHDIYAASSRPFRPPIISGINMAVEGQCFGIIGPIFRFTTITDNRSRSQLVSALHQLVMWIHMAFPRGDQTQYLVAYQHPASSSFAILEGKFPPRRPTHYQKLKPTGSKVHRWREVTVERKPWAAPYDFTELRDEFIVHQRFLDIINRHYAAAIDQFVREAGFQGRDHAAALVSIWTQKILDGIKGDATILNYIIKVVNRLVDEGRCLFVMPNGFAGSGPLETKDGDQVYLVPGVRAPLLLRSEGEKWVFSLVGAVLVHGLMRGEEFKEGRLTRVTLR